MAYKVVVAPSEEPVTLAEAKAHCRIDGAEFDAIIPGLITSARELAEHETGRAFCSQTRELVLDTFPDAFELRGAPIVSLVSVKYLDSSGVEQTLDPNDTLLDKDSEPGWLMPAYGKAWPSSYPVPNAVRVRYVCGYGGSADVPESIKAWIKLAVGFGVSNTDALVTGSMSELPGRFFDRLLDPHKVY